MAKESQSFASERGCRKWQRGEEVDEEDQLVFHSSASSLSKTFLTPKPDTNSLS